MPIDDSESEELHPAEVEFENKVAHKEVRMMKAIQDKPHSIWFGLRMIGLIGWSVAVPTLLGAAVRSLH